MSDQKKFSRIARDECCNWKLGGCIGAVFGDDLKIKMEKKRPVCLVSEDKHCRFFIECVLPGVPESATAIQAYKSMVGLVQDMTGFRECPGTGSDHCGTRLEPKMRLCPDCRNKHRKAANREAWRRRKGGASNSAVKPNSPPKTLGISGSLNQVS